MGIMDTGVEALALTKAIVEVVDTSEKQKGSIKDIKNSVGKINDHAAKKAKFSAIKTKIALAQQTSAMARLTAAVTGMNIEGELALKELESKFEKIQDAVIRRFTVQFNPSTLRINGSGGGMNNMTNFGGKEGKDRGVSYGAATDYIEMSVQLVFDETNNMVAFPGDITNINISNAANAGITAGINKLKGFDVETNVEGFIGALRNEYTRQIAFCWGKMIYSGVLNRVHAKYTLFNPSGQPVRATVDMSLICADPDINADSMGYWAKKHDEFFDQDKSLSGERNSLVNLTNFSR